MQRTVRPANLAEAIGSRQEDQPAASKERSKMKSAAAERARETGEASRATHRHYLLANFESLKDKANELRRSLLLAYHKLATPTPTRTGARGGV